MEGFGNARTSRNNNSSRFCKLTQIKIKNNVLILTQIETLLLTYSRVTSTSKNESNFHIFNSIIHQTSEHEKQLLLLDNDMSFKLAENKFIYYNIDTIRYALSYFGCGEDIQHSIFKYDIKISQSNLCNIIYWRN